MPTLFGILINISFVYNPLNPSTLMKHSLSILIFALASLSINAQVLNSNHIDVLVERTIEAFDVPGIAVAIIKDGEVIHSKGYGIRSLDSGKPVDENTLFGIASNSKAFTTSALSMLVDEGKLSWDDRVIDHIPEFRFSWFSIE